MIIITGTYPPEKCGVGDYINNMLQAKSAKHWKLFYDKNWSLKTFAIKCKQIKSCEDKIVNLQYPTVGYSTSLLPHLLCIYIRLFTSKTLVITMHEFSRLGWKGKLAAILFFITAHKLIFTTEFERKNAKRFSPLIQKKSRIIKIYSNIAPSVGVIPIENRIYDIGYFGYIRDHKGLEEFISVSMTLKQENPKYNIYIMGQTQDEFRFFHEPLLEKLKYSGISLFLNKSEKDVANILGNTKLAYLPYPDGISERRGSFLAVINNLCIIVSTIGECTTEAHKIACHLTSKESAANQIDNLLRMDSNFYAKRQKIMLDFIKTEIPESWDDVVEQYKSFIKEK